MKAVRVDGFSEDPGRIRVEQVPVPEPGPGQVRVRMLMSPVHPSDLLFVRGDYFRALERVIWNQGRQDSEGRIFFDPGLRNECPMPPFTLGGEGVGVVEKCGAGFLARRLKGKRVAVAGGPPNGVWREFAVIDARRAVTVPAQLPDEQAAVYLGNPISAFAMVREVLEMQRDDRLLVTAAGSALGKSVVRLGRRFGFRTICVVRSGANSAELVRLGAEAVIETDRHDLVAEVARVTGGIGVTAAIDCVGGKVAGDVVRCLGLGGHLLLYGTMSSSSIDLPPRDLMMPLARIEGFYLGNWMSRQSPLKLLAVLRAVKRLTAEGVFHTDVAGIYPLEQVQQAVAAATMPGRTGKILLQIG